MFYKWAPKRRSEVAEEVFEAIPWDETGERMEKGRSAWQSELWKQMSWSSEAEAPVLERPSG